MSVRKLSLLAGVVLSIPVLISAAKASDQAGRIEVAQSAPSDAQTPLTEEEKKKRALELLKKKQQQKDLQPKDQTLPAPGAIPPEKKVIPAGKVPATTPGAEPNGATGVPKKDLRTKDTTQQLPTIAPADKTAVPVVKVPQAPGTTPTKPPTPPDSAPGAAVVAPKKDLRLNDQTPPAANTEPTGKSVAPADKLPATPPSTPLKHVTPSDSSPSGAAGVTSKDLQLKNGTQPGTAPAGKTIAPAGNAPVATPGTAPNGVSGVPDTGKRRTLPGALQEVPKVILAPSPAAPAVLPTLAPAPKLEAIKKGRQEHVEDGGKRTVIEEPGNRTIVKQGDQIAIQHDESDRLRRLNNAQTQKRADGITETFYVRPDGIRVVTETDPRGRVLRVYRRREDGEEFEIIDNRRFFQAGVGVGIGVLGLAIALELAPPVVTIPRDRYIVDYRRASDDDLYEALDAPPLDRLERAYSLDEIRYNEALRERMRRIDLDSINFRSGASEPGPDQFAKLERLARALLRVLERHPFEVFLIEGYTDAVGSELDNLSLSDRRAEAIAQILTETFGVPPENLITQGYGERFLKIDTQRSEPANRRVAVRRITPLMAQR